MRLVVDDLFVDLFGIAVRRERFLDRRGLIYRQMIGVRLTINRAGRGENDILHLMQTHYFQQRNEAAEVITVIKKRLLYRLSDRFAGCKMDDTYDIRKLFENMIQVHEVTAVNIGEIGFLTHNSGNSVQYIDGRVTEIVNNRNVVALLHQLDGRVRTDISGSAGD